MKAAPMQESNKLDQTTITLTGIRERDVQFEVDPISGKPSMHITFNARPLDVNPTDLIEQLRNNGLSRKEANVMVGDLMDDLGRKFILRALGDMLE